jgi:hypothetical protein
MPSAIKHSATDSEPPPPAKRRKVNRINTKQQFAATYAYANTGAQDAMFKSADEAGHAFYVVHQNPHRGYASYATADDFAHVYSSILPADRHFYEIAREGRPVRFYADVEFVTEGRDDAGASARLHTLLQHVVVLLAQVCVQVTLQDFVVLVGSRPYAIKDDTPAYKHSFHVNLKHVYFENNEVALKAFMERLRTAIEEDDTLHWTKWIKAHDSWREKLEPIVDFNTNTRNRAWRLPFSSKAGDQTHTALTAMTSAFQTMDAIITVPPGPDDTVVTEALLEITRHIPARQPRAHQSRGSLLPTTDQTDEIQQLTRMLRTHGDHTSRIVGAAVTSANEFPRLYNGRNGGNRTCPWGHEHDSNNFYLTVAVNGEVSYHCHASSKSCSGEKVVYGFVADDTQPDDFDIDTSGLFRVKRYAEEYVQPYDADTKVLMVRSGMNTGKTFMLRKTLNEKVPRPVPCGSLTRVGITVTRDVNLYPRVLVIGTRIAFDKTMQGALQELGFKLYLNVDDVKVEDRLIIQYESLHRLVGNKGLAPFDCVVIDEIESMLGNTTSPMNKEHLQANAEIFKALITTSTRVLAMDADISNKSVKCFKDLVGPENITLHWNTRPSMKRDLVIHAEFDPWLGRIKADLQAGKRLVIATGSRSKAERHILPLLLEFGVAYKFYNSKCDDAILRDFESLEEAWSALDVVVFTSKVTVGADFSVRNHFDRIYAYASQNSVAPRTLLQMCGRCRYPVDEQIHVFIQTNQADTERTTLADINQRFTQHISTMNRYQAQIFQMNAGLNPDTNRIELKLMPTWLSRVYAFNELERERAKTNYRDELLRLASSKGYMVLFSSSPADDDEPEEDDKAAWAAHQAQQFDDTDDIGMQEANDIEKKVSSAQADHEEKLQLDKYKYKAYFSVPVDGQHFVDVNKHMGKLVNLCMTTRAGPDAVLYYDRNRWGPTYAEMANVSYTKLELVKEVAAHVGLEHTCDTDTVVTSRHLESIAHELDRLKPACHTEFSLRSGPAEPHGTILQAALSFVNQVYGAWCGARLKRTHACRPRRGGGRRGREYKYQLTFPPIHDGHSLLDLARDATFFTTRD